MCPSTCAILLSMKAKSTKGQLTRQRILLAASKLIQKKGVNGTSIDDVLEASNTGKSQFYHYFESKEALVLELIGNYGRIVLGATALDDEQKVPLMTPDPGLIKSLEALFVWFDEILESFESGAFTDGCPIGNLACEMSSQNEEIRSLLRETLKKWESWLQKTFETLKESGQLPLDIDPVETSTFILASIEGALILAKTERHISPLRQTIHGLKRYLQFLQGQAPKTRRLPRPMTLSFAP